MVVESLGSRVSSETKVSVAQLPTLAGVVSSSGDWQCPQMRLACPRGVGTALYSRLLFLTVLSLVTARCP
jgi:hypothetical protein